MGQQMAAGGEGLPNITQSFTWTPPRTKAAELLADGALSEEQVAAQVGVIRKTLYNWRQIPEFNARVAARRAAQRAAIEAKGIADKQNRIAFLNERHVALRQVVRERGEDESIAHIPGATTGYVVRTFKTIGVGPHAQTIEEHGIDTGLLKEFRAHEQQAAQELGEWVEKKDTTLDATDKFIAAMMEWGTGGDGDA